MAVSSQAIASPQAVIPIPSLSPPTVAYPSPVGGASLLLAFKPTQRQTLLVIGAGLLAAIRAFAALEAGFHVVVAYDEASPLHGPCGEVQYRSHQKQIDLVALTTKGDTEEERFQRLFQMEILRDLSLACVTDTLIPYSPAHSTQDWQQNPNSRSFESAKTISKLCRARNIPVNVADMPSLCDFTFPATHRFTTTNTTKTKTTALDLTPSVQHAESQALSSTSTASGLATAESSAGPSDTAIAYESKPSSLQFAITTNGQACRLASRLKREVVSALPRDVGSAVDNVGDMRRMLVGARSSISAATNPDGDGNNRSPAPPHHAGSALEGLASSGGEEEEDASAVTPPVNAPVQQDNIRGQLESEEERRNRRMRWIAQMSEYWPLEMLASLTKLDMEEALLKSGTAVAGEKDVPKRMCPKRRLQPDPNSEPTVSNTSTVSPDEPVHAATSSGVNPTASRHGITLNLDEPVSLSKGRILLVGSGPGHPSLLTVAARRALTELGTLILSDKLVPTQVLDLIPKNKKLYIAKKYPGNAEGAQNELMEMALEGALKGETVVRLKQGDPFLYGRGGEEVLFFRSHGFEPLVIPGVSSALAGPLLAGIPVTQRGVAESLTVCTGVGRKGRDVDLPGYERSRTLVILMGVARLSQLVTALTDAFEDNGTAGSSLLASSKKEGETDRTAARRRRGAAYPGWTPIAIIERASCPDQRVLVSTLNDVEEALTRLGEQRPPGMIVVGWAAVSLTGAGDLGVLDDANDSRQPDGPRTSGSGNDDTEEIKAVVGGNQGHCSESEDVAESLSAKDKARVGRWLGGERWRVYDGLPNADTWNLFS